MIRGLVGREFTNEEDGLFMSLCEAWRRKLGSYRDRLEGRVREFIAAGWKLVPDSGVAHMSNGLGCNHICYSCEIIDADEPEYDLILGNGL